METIKFNIAENKSHNFEDLFHRNYIKLVRFAITIVDNQDVAEDIVQDVFLKYWESTKYKAISKSVEGYLFIAVRNKCFNYNESNKKKQEKLHKLDSEWYDIFDFEIIEKSNRYKKVFESIELLPPKGKIVLKLVCLENLKYKEVAEELGISVNTVKHHLTNSLKFLRSKLTKENFMLFILLNKNNMELQRKIEN